MRCAGLQAHRTLPARPAQSLVLGKPGGRSRGWPLPRGAAACGCARAGQRGTSPLCPLKRLAPSIPLMRRRRTSITFSVGSDHSGTPHAMWHAARQHAPWSLALLPACCLVQVLWLSAWVHPEESLQLRPHPAPLPPCPPAPVKLGAYCDLQTLTDDVSARRLGHRWGTQHCSTGSCQWRAPIREEHACQNTPLATRPAANSRRCMCKTAASASRL